MKIKDIVLTFEQVQQLKECGLDIKAYDTAFYYHMVVGERGEKDMPVLVVKEDFNYACQSKEDCYPTLTSQEIWDILPEKIYEGNIKFELEIGNYGTKDMWMQYKSDNNGVLEDSYMNTEFNCTSKDILNLYFDMLCFVVSNGYFKN